MQVFCKSSQIWIATNLPGIAYLSEDGSFSEGKSFEHHGFSFFVMTCAPLDSTNQPINHEETQKIKPVPVSRFFTRHELSSGNHDVSFLAMSWQRKLWLIKTQQINPFLLK